MFSFHKPKTYRSASGCCICGAKSSSSRFTDSAKYEHDFDRCFKVTEERCGEICNACVLLVKRWKKLPAGSNRNWNHVVDARSGPGSKGLKGKVSKSRSDRSEVEIFKKICKKKKTIVKKTIEEDSLSSMFEDISNNSSGFDKRSWNGVRTRSKQCPLSPSPSNTSEEYAEDDDDMDNDKPDNSKPRYSSFIDLSYWKKTEVCCGIIFKGKNGEVLVDVSLLRPCANCNSTKSDLKTNEPQSTFTEPAMSDQQYTQMQTNDTEETTCTVQYDNIQPPTPTSPLDLTISKRDYEDYTCIATEC